MVLTGHCLCNAVTYTIDVDAPLITGYDHCDDCQRQSGSTYCAFSCLLSSCSSCSFERPEVPAYRHAFIHSGAGYPSPAVLSWDDIGMWSSCITGWTPPTTSKRARSWARWSESWTYQRLKLRAFARGISLLAKESSVLCNPTRMTALALQLSEFLFEARPS